MVIEKFLVGRQYVETYKKCRFYLFRFLDYQINHYEVKINSNKVYGVLFDYDI